VVGCWYIAQRKWTSASHKVNLISYIKFNIKKIAMVSSCILGLSCSGQGSVVGSGDLNNELLHSTKDGEFIQGSIKGQAAAQGASL
jgi:hypothetical protein